MTGGVVSATVTLNDAVAVLPAASTAVHVTVNFLEPIGIGNVEPEAGEHEIAMSPPTSSCVTVPSSANVTVPSTSSCADTSNETTAPSAEVASAVIPPSGTVMTGAVVSGAGFTVTVNDAVEVLPALSVAVHVTVVVPIGNRLPEAGVHSTGTIPSTSS